MPQEEPLSCWVISDGRRGIENQALGLAEALSAPDIAIGCGRQAIAALLAIKKTDPSCFTIYVQDPKIDHFTKGDHENHLAAAQNLLVQNHSLLITTSRRTPNWALEDYEALAENHENVWLYSGDGENPYFAFLGGAEIILITEDSTNMLTEACATGKPVFTLPLSGDAGKFGTLYQALAERCDLKPYAGDPIAPDYPALKETDRIADQVWAHYERRSATLN